MKPGKLLNLLLLTLCLGVSPFGMAADAPNGEARNPVQPRILFVANDPGHMQGKKALLEEVARRSGVSLRTVYALLLEEDDYAGLFEGVDLVLIDTHNKALGDSIMSRAGPEVAVAQVFSNPARIVARQGIAADVHQQLRAYWVNGGRVNYERMFRFLLARHFRTAPDAVEAPLVVPDSGVYHPRFPNQMTASAREYLDWIHRQSAAERADAPVVGLIINRVDIDNDQTELIDAMIARIERAGALALPVFFHDRPDTPDGMRRTLLENGKPLADVLIYATTPHLPMERRAEIEAMGIPTLGTARFRATAVGGDAVAAWKESAVGIPMANIPSALATPEYVGIADISLIAAESQDRRQRELIFEQFDSLVAKALKLVRLQRIENREKRVVIMFYNSPPGEKNLSASNLNIPESLSSILSALKASGYETEALSEETLTGLAQKTLAPFYHAGKLEPLLRENLAAAFPVAEYRAWFDRLPETTRNEITARWGKPEDSSMVIDVGGAPSFVIPRVASGKVVMLRQPPRGDRLDEREKAIYHDVRLPPNHYYLASYLWARQAYGADALVHLGTHGTQEWMPGKERGLSIYDPPNLAVGDVPVFYPYIVADIGEAIQAKRRGRALIISHQTPPYAPSGLHTDLMRLHDLIHDHASIQTPAVRDKLRGDIVAVVTQGHYHEDIGWDEKRMESDFDAFLEALQAYLHELAEQNQPLGLHAFGVTPSDEHRLTTVMQMLGKPFLEAVFGQGSEEAGEAFAVDYQNIRESEPFKLLLRHVAENAPLPSGASPELPPLVEKGRRYYAALAADGETGGLLAALSGRHLPVSSGDDPIRNPESLPTGRNLYGFDPARVPSPQAWKAAEESLPALIRQHREKHGEAPKKLAFTLWSVETMRQHGVLEAQIFQALGVRPVWDEGGRVSGVELIPGDELRRPRIDVLVTASGAYRDMFPNALKRIDEAVALVAALDEPGNPVREDVRNLTERLTAKGVARETAEKYARLRIFGPASGNYGTGLSDAALASDTFGESKDGKQDRQEGESKLAGLYIDRLGHFWDEEGKVDEAAEAIQTEIFTEHLKKVDAAVLARSSNIYGLVNIDDAYQYLGGLALAVRSLTGKSPETYIADLRNPRQARIETTEKFIASEMRTRYFHPNWVAEMQQEDYAGAVEMLKSVSNFWGWQVMAPEVVRPDQWREFHEIYVRDKFNLGLPQWFEQHAPHAQAQMIERMLEAVRKEYWDADSVTVGELKERYRYLAREFDVVSDNARFNEFVGLAPERDAADSAQGFGLDAATPETAAPPQEMQEPRAEPDSDRPAQQVEGMRLEKAEPAPAADFPFLSLLGLLCLAFATFGGAANGWRRPDFSTLHRAEKLSCNH
jgi:cobaltochelatase CobN